MSRSVKIQTVLAALCVVGSFVFLWSVYQLSATATDQGVETSLKNPRQNHAVKDPQFRKKRSTMPGTPMANLGVDGVYAQIMPSTPEPMDLPGVTDLAVTDSRQIELPDEAEFIVVSVDGTARAYLIEGMSDPETHIVHDTLNQKPITVAFCDMTDHGRAFIRQDINPEDFRMGGWSGKEMSMLIKGEQYNLSDPSVPLPEHPVKRVNFTQLKMQFPAIEIFLGNYGKINNAIPPKKGSGDESPNTQPKLELK